MISGDLLSFGSYLLDRQARRLTRDGDEVVLGRRHFDLLCLLASHPDQVLSKDRLADTAWQGLAVTSNSVDQAISTLRRTVTLPSGEPCVETCNRRGYKFVAKVSPVVRREPDESIDAVLETHRAWMEGRAALEMRRKHVVCDWRRPTAAGRRRGRRGRLSRGGAPSARTSDGARGTGDGSGGSGRRIAGRHGYLPGRQVCWSG